MMQPIAVPGGQVRLRREREDDAAFLDALFRSAATPLPGLPPQTAETLLAMQFRSQRATYAAAYPQAWPAIIERHGQAAGRLLVAPGTPGLAALIVDYALMPDARSRGLGGNILGKVLTRMGVPTRATVLAENHACRAMCSRLGFTVAEEQPPHVTLEWRPGNGG